MKIQSQSHNHHGVTPRDAECPDLSRAVRTFVRATLHPGESTEEDISAAARGLAHATIHGLGQPFFALRQHCDPWGDPDGILAETRRAIFRTACKTQKELARELRLLRRDMLVRSDNLRWRRLVLRALRFKDGTRWLATHLTAAIVGLILCVLVLRERPESSPPPSIASTPSGVPSHKLVPVPGPPMPPIEGHPLPFTQKPSSISRDPSSGAGIPVAIDAETQSPKVKSPKVAGGHSLTSVQIADPNPKGSSSDAGAGIPPVKKDRFAVAGAVPMGKHEPRRSALSTRTAITPYFPIEDFPPLPGVIARVPVEPPPPVVLLHAPDLSAPAYPTRSWQIATIRCTFKEFTP